MPLLPALRSACGTPFAEITLSKEDNTMLLNPMATIILTVFLSVSTPLNVLANESVHRPSQTSQSPCDVLRDAFVWSLFKPIGSVLEQYKDERQFIVDNVVKVKRLEQGQYYWEATLKVTTFEGAHNPPYKHYLITFTNLFSNEVTVKNVKPTN
jgi:hypothetical protein